MAGTGFADSSGTAIVAGWHGKLPTLGDFASRRLHPTFIAAWDAWLSAGLGALLARPGGLQAYLGSPVWRFVLLPGAWHSLSLPPADTATLDAQAWAGVLMPSVDRIGRYYPLTLATPLPAWPAGATQAEALWRWLIQLDDTAADALHDDWSADRLEAELQRLPLPALHGEPATRAGPAHAASLDALAAWLAPDTAPLSNGATLWIAQPECGAGRQFVAPGLGTAGLVHRLIGGAVPGTRDNTV